MSTDPTMRIVLVQGQAVRNFEHALRSIRARGGVARFDAERQVAPLPQSPGDDWAWQGRVLAGWRLLPEEQQVGGLFQVGYERTRNFDFVSDATRNGVLGRIALRFRFL